MLFLTLLAAVGLSHLIVDGSIFGGLRSKLVNKYRETKPWIVELISCYQCSGFWTGCLTGLVLQPVSWGLFGYLPFWWALCLSTPLWLFATPLLIGWASSYLSMAGAAFLNFLDAPAKMITKDDQRN